MNAKDYEKACFETLTDDQYYEERDSDPNPGYRKDLDLIIDEMNKKGYISETENTILREGTRSPCFYGLPKIHKKFTNFPPLRPICSGYESCTAKTSEWVDSFLKPAARKTFSYIKDTTDFVKHIEDLDSLDFYKEEFISLLWTYALYTQTSTTKKVLLLVGKLLINAKISQYRRITFQI